MYIGTLTLCAVIALLGILAIAAEVILNRLVFEEIEEDVTDYGLE